MERSAVYETRYEFTLDALRQIAARPISECKPFVETLWMDTLRDALRETYRRKNAREYTWPVEELDALFARFVVQVEELRVIALARDAQLHPDDAEPLTVDGWRARLDDDEMTIAYAERICGRSADDA
jgi:hypothetical protein